MKDLISMEIEETTISHGMAVPKSRRSKSKGKIRLANWKKKAEKASKLALNSAKTFFQKEKTKSTSNLETSTNNDIQD